MFTHFMVTQNLQNTLPKYAICYIFFKSVYVICDRFGELWLWKHPQTLPKIDKNTLKMSILHVFSKKVYVIYGHFVELLVEKTPQNTPKIPDLSYVLQNGIRYM